MTYENTPTVSSAREDQLVFVLANGLQVVIQEDHFAPVVAIQIWVKAGGADETPEQAGVAHVHEHMVFKGTERRTVGDIAAEVESSGGLINAWTSADHTVYHLVLASRHFATGLDIIADAVNNSAFDPHELAKELQVVMEEWKRGEDTPTSKAATELFQLAYTTHPYNRPVIGYRETIESLNRERVIDFYRQWYRPNNMVLAIVGDVDKDQTRQEVLRLFAHIPAASLPQRPRPLEPPQTSLRLSTIDMAVEEFHLYMAFHIPPVHHQDTFALDILGYIMGGGESSRLVQNLQVEKELVNSISASAYTPIDAGLMVAAASLEQEKIDEALRETLVEIFRFKHELVSPEELSCARTNLASDFIYRQETVQGKARQLSYCLTVFDDPEYETKYLEGLSRVTRHDLQRVAKTYLTADNLSLVLLGPNQDTRLPTEKDVITICEQTERSLTEQEKPLVVSPRTTDQVSFTVLPNGVRLLVKEHHEVPVFSLRALTLGGMLFENEADTGINNFLAGMLTRGTDRLSRQAMVQAVESMAGSLDGFSGRNSLGLAGAFLTAHVDDALDLFLEALLNPTFPEEETEKYRREILLALKNREDDLVHTAFDLFRTTLFTRHPYRFSIWGTPETIHSLRRDSLVQYYRTLLAPERLVVSVVGDIDGEYIISRLNKALEGLPQSVTVPAFPALEPRPKEIRRQEKPVDKNQAHLVVGFQGTSLASPDRHPLKVIEAILSRQGGRLFFELREQRALAYALNAFSVEGLSPGLFGIYLGTDPHKVDEALSATLTELRRLQEEPVGATELDQAKKYLIGSYEISLQSNAAQAEEMGFNELYGLGYQAGQKYLEALRNVSVEDIRQAAQSYFDLNAYTLAVVGR
jgi:zinc protease